MFKIKCETIEDGRRVYGEMLSILMTKYFEEYGRESKVLSMDYGIVAHQPRIDKELYRFKVKSDRLLSVSHIRCAIHGFTLMFVTSAKTRPVAGFTGWNKPYSRSFSIDSVVYVDIPDELWTLEFMLARGGVSV